MKTYTIVVGKDEGDSFMFDVRASDENEAREIAESLLESAVRMLNNCTLDTTIQGVHTFEIECECGWHGYDDELVCDIIHEEAGRTIWVCPKCGRVPDYGDELFKE